MKRLSITVVAALAACTLLSTTADARREPRRSFTPVRHLTDAREDDRFRVTPPPPTRDEQLRPLPSFFAPPGSPGSTGRGVHNSIWNRVRHHDWAMQQRAIAIVRQSMRMQPKSGVKTIVVRDRRTPPSTAPATSQPARDVPIISSITIR